VVEQCSAISESQQVMLEVAKVLPEHKAPMLAIVG